MYETIAGSGAPGILFLVSLILLATAAAADGPGLTAHQLAELRTVEEIAISPDGESIAYVLEVPRRPFEDEDGKAWKELHVVAADGSSRAYVTGERVSDIAWVPGASAGEISFLAKRKGDEEISLYVIPLAGGEAQRLLAFDGDEVREYSWSPDGTRVAALAKEEESEELVELRGHGFTQKIMEEQPRPVRIWIAERDGGEELRALELEGWYGRGVLWSPAGDRLAVKVSPRGGPDDGLVATKVWIVKPSGEVVARVANPGKLGDWAWSPDGGHLAVISAADPSDPGEGRLTVVGAEGGELRDLLPGLEAHVSQVAWKDGERLVFVVDQGVETWIGEIGADGRGKKTRLAGGGPIWSDLSVAGGALALIGSTPGHPEEVFRLGAGESKAQRLTDGNPWLASVELASQEAITYQARDGLEIGALLMRPLGEEADRRYPLVVIVHGGPESHFSNGWITNYSRPGQVLAGRGYAVLYPNYRASTGRGVEFSKLDHGDPAGKEFDDLVDGVDHLIDVGLVDRNRVGITGGSYGGFATAWGATYYSERFAAGVMFVGISNNTAKLGTSDIPVELYQVHSRKWPWSDWQFFLERSPIFYVEKARTPLLILHGEDDPRVHPTQSLQLYRYLKLIGKTPVRLVQYPGEKHGNQRAASRLDYSLRTVRWMDHYLKGPGGDPPPPEVAYQPVPSVTRKKDQELGKP